jgi:hypothetical protein
MYVQYHNVRDSPGHGYQASVRHLMSFSNTVLNRVRNKPVHCLLLAESGEGCSPPNLSWVVIRADNLKRPGRDRHPYYSMETVDFYTTGWTI